MNNGKSERLERLKAVNIKTVGYETMQCSRWFPVFVPPHGGSSFLQYAANQLPNDIVLLTTHITVIIFMEQLNHKRKKDNNLQ